MRFARLSNSVLSSKSSDKALGRPLVAVKERNQKVVAAALLHATHRKDLLHHDPRKKRRIRALLLSVIHLSKRKMVQASNH
jgi:hypothetical protein